MTHLKHWQDAVIAALGAWLFLSPWALGYQGETAAMMNSAVIGLALMALAFGAMVSPHAWEEWTLGGIGLWLIVSPWLFGFSAAEMAMRNAVLTGVGVLVLAMWTLLTAKEYAAWRGDSPAR